MAKKKKKKVVAAEAAADMVMAAPAGGKTKQELVQEVYDDELKGAVKTFIQNTIDKPTVGKIFKDAETVFLTSLERNRVTQARVLELIAGGRLRAIEDADAIL